MRQLLVVDFPIFQQEKKLLPFLIRARGYYLFESHAMHVTGALWRFFSKIEIIQMVPWHFLHFLNNNNLM